MNTQEKTAHWESVYSRKAPDAVSWYQKSLRTSLELIQLAAPGPDEPIIDAGGGASTLIDDLLALGYRRLAVLDISAGALARARERLGPLAARVQWLEADILSAPRLGGTYALWHDRALFHFLTTEAERSAYRSALGMAVRPGGHAIVATFGPAGPERCSGLPAARYSAESLQAAVGSAFTLRETRREEHITPTGNKQEFIYGLFRREA